MSQKRPQEGKMKDSNDQVEQQTRCLACGAMWSHGFTRKSSFKAEKGLNCPFCSEKGKAVRELLEDTKQKQ